MKKKKYATGTGYNGVIRNYIESPDEAIAENEIAIAKAKAKAETNPWAIGTNMLGNMLISYAGSKSGQAGNIGSALKGANQFSNSYMAMGGTATSVPIEAEGKEVIQTPNGMMQELVGPSHENGGIDLLVPEGTDVFSKRLKGPDGKTMADRKKAREKAIKKLEKLLNENPHDEVLKKTLARTKSNNEQQEGQDKAKMEFARHLLNGMHKMATGGTVGFPPFDFSSLFTSVPNFDSMSGTSADYHTDPGSQQLFTGKVMPGETAGIPDNSQKSTIDYGAIDSYFKDAPISDNASMDGIGMTDQEKTFDEYAARLNTPYEGGQEGMPEADGSSWLDKMFDGGDGTGVTFGDAIGLGGNLVSTFGPYMNTLKNRSKDRPNKNYFQDFGNDALQRMEDAKGQIAEQRDLALKDIETSRVGSINRNRNSARSVNTQRALDLATDMGVNQQRAQMYGAFAQQMMNILGQQAGMENVQDQMVMQGEKERDINDRMDQDNFYTQLAQDISTMGTGLQKTGKDVNAIKTRNVTQKTLNQMYDNFKVNSMTGEIKTVAEQELATDPDFYSTMSKTKAQKVWSKIASGEYVRKGNVLYDKEGNVLDVNNI